MAGFQFLRQECYASVRSQTAPTKSGGKRLGGGKRAAREIVAEATRAPDSTPHVQHPAPPRVLHGIDTDELLIWCEQLETVARDQTVPMRDGKTRRQRSDTPILMGMVASYPGPADEGDPEYVRWRDLTAAWSLKRYGDTVVSILEHTDEPHGHVHVLVASGGRSVKPLHAGYAASLAAQNAGATRKEQGIAYAGGCRALQDDYHQQVAIPCGLARIGPRRRRLSRAEWMSEQAAHDAAAKAIADADAKTAAADALWIKVKAAEVKVEADAERNVRIHQALDSVTRARTAALFVAEGDEPKSTSSKAAKPPRRPGTP
jgi:hypothetical protein